MRQSISTGMQAWTSCNDDRLVDALDVCSSVLCMNLLAPNEQPCCGSSLSSLWGSVMAGTTELTRWVHDESRRCLRAETLEARRGLVSMHWLWRGSGKPTLSASTVMMLLSWSVSPIPFISLPTTLVTDPLGAMLPSKRLRCTLQDSTARKTH